MQVSARARHRNAGRPAEKDARGFLQWVRGRACCFEGKGECGGKVEAMHLDFAGGKGVGTKVADRHTIPACRNHHALQHLKGWATFCRWMGVTKEDLLGAADFLWSKWPGRAAWERKLEQ